MIVVDSNVLAYLYLPGEHTAAAEQLFASEPEWASPVLWRSEFRNILAGYLRRGTVTFNQALAIQAEAESILAGNEYEVDSPGVLQLVRESNCSAYDCEFVYHRGPARNHAGNCGQEATKCVSGARKGSSRGLTPH